MNNNYYDNPHQFNQNNKKNKHRLFSFALYGFYLICFAFFIIFIVSWWDKKETFFLSTNEVIMITNDDYQIGLYGKTEDKKNSSYIYTSSNENIATIDSNGLIHSISEGETEITVKSKYSSKKNVMKVYVEGDSIYSIKFVIDRITLDLGEAIELKPIVNDNPEFRADLIWKIDNTRIVSLDSNGVLVAKNPGITYVNVTVRNTRISTKLKVIVSNEKYVEDNTSDIDSNNIDKQNNKEIKEEVTTSPDEEEINKYVGVIDVVISLEKKDLNVGDVVKASYIISPLEATNKEAVWSSSNEEVASVDNNGIIRAHKPGKADISITTKDSNKTSFVTINVNEPNQAEKVIKLNKNYTVLKSMNKEIFSVNVIPNESELVWKSEDPSIAVVTNDGTVFGWDEGQTVVTVSTKDGSVSDSCIIRVANSDVKVEEINIDKSDVEISLGNEVKLVATIKPNDATNQSIVYSSSNPEIATVDQKGNVKGISPGKVVVSATASNGMTAETNVTVKDIKIKKLVPAKKSLLMVKGNKTKLNISITPSNATNKKLEYVSSNKDVITIDNDGNVNAKDLGTAKIKIKSTDGSGKYTNVEIRVIPSTPAIKVSDKNYKSYYENIRNNLLRTGNSKHMQNFAIQNLGKSNEIIYLSGVTYSNIDKKIYESNKKKYSADLSRTLIVRIPKKEINSNGDNRNYMYINNAGHGQSFDLEDDGTIWTNANAITPYYDSGSYWGNHNGTMRISFNSEKGNPKVKLQVTDPTTKRAIAGTETSIDESNNLIAMRAGENVYVYKLSDARKGKLTLLYEFPLEPANGLNRQGFEIYGGFYYTITGKVGKNIVISVYDMYGNRRDRKVFYIHKAYASKCAEEPEGIKVYNNRIFIGYTHSYCAKVNKVNFNGVAFDIGYLY